MKVCTHCGEKVSSLFTKLPNGLIKISDCQRCGCTADKYIEYDLVLVIIDVLLLRIEAYRHILFNSEFKVRRTVFLLLVAEAYCKWVLDEHFLYQRLQNSEKSFFGSKSPLYFRAPGEWRFYYWFLLSSLEAFSCFSFAFILLSFNRNFSMGTAWHAHFDAFVLGNFVKIFSLCILVWLPTQQSQSYLFIISILAACSLWISFKAVYSDCRLFNVFLSVLATFVFPFVICPLIDDALRPMLFG